MKFELIVVHRLEAGAREQLRNDGKGAGILILARLKQLTGSLRWGAAADSTADLGEGANPFVAIATEHADGRVTVDHGQAGSLPVLDSAQIARLALGRSLLLASPTAAAHGGFYLVVRGAAATGSYPRMWGYLTEAGAITGLELVRRGIDLCLEDRRGPLACNGARDSLTGAGSPLTEHWTLFLKNEFGASAWALTASQPRSDALAPLAEFRRSLLLGLLIAIVLVFMLSHIQIRRCMTPLADLEAGTRRLSNGDFSSRVARDTRAARGQCRRGGDSR